MNRLETIAFLETVRAKKLCAYIGSRCDCKYGADNVGGGHESGNGCPEMYCVKAMFEHMSDAEFDRLNKRAEKKSRFFYKS